MTGQLEKGIQIDGADNTTIGNVADSLKVAVTQSTLPIGASTSVLQISGNASLSSIDVKTPSLGQSTMTGSTPVVIASNQSAVPASQSGTWTVRNQDGTGNNLIVTNTELQTRDIANAGGTQGAITVGTSAVLAASNGSSNFTNRKSITVYNNGSVLLYFGHTNAVTTSTGIPITPGTGVIFSAGPSTNVYLISGTAGQNVRITEMA